ncbi:MAG: gliding motility-associated C-terminal domain-containing protein, partial [Marinilabiliales bacterium]|nr:gliding motility-associated C-terminal domain-containing protein [Marinilabiliales bacterium]
KKKGDFYFTVTAFNSTGCKNMKAGYIRVVSSAVQAVAGRDTIVGVCNTYWLDASASTGSGLTFKWNMLDPGGILSAPNGVKTSLALQPGYTGPLPATIRVLLTATDNVGNVGYDTVQVKFSNAPVAGIYYSKTPNKDGTTLIDGTVSTGLGLKFKWTTQKGEIVGDPTKSQALIRGAAIYSLEVTDQFGCKSLKTFPYPFDSGNLIANADYIRTSWVDSVHIHVLNNDFDAQNAIDRHSVTILQQPLYGTARMGDNGIVIYSPKTRKAAVDQFVYQVCNTVNMCDTAIVTVDIFDGPVWVPEAISANGDGHNEFFVIKGIEDYKNSSLLIYSRAGQLVYKSMDYQNDWSGKAFNSSLSDGTLLPTGTYYYVLHLGGTEKYIKGFVYLLH